MYSTETVCTAWKFAFFCVWQYEAFWVSNVQLHERTLQPPAGAIALETSSKVEAGAATSLLCWGEPLCSRLVMHLPCLNILKLHVLAFWGDPSPLQNSEHVFC